MSFENLRAYQAALLLRAEVDRLRTTLDPIFEALFAHLDDAVDSIMNNLAEGGESIYPGKQKLFYDIAAGSAKEARSCLRSLDARGAFRGANARRAIVLTLVIGKLIAGLLEALKSR